MMNDPRTYYGVCSPYQFNLFALKVNGEFAGIYDLEKSQQAQWKIGDDDQCSVTRDKSWLYKITVVNESPECHYLRYWKEVGVALRTPYNGFSFPSLDV